MALSASTVWEVQTGGSDTNGGGYSSGGTDYSQQTSPQLTVSDGACSGNTTLTSATGGFTAAMIGNVTYLSSGPGWYEITAYTDTNTVTIDRNGPSASGMTVNVGGCLASPGQLGSLLTVGGMKGWIKAGTYTVTTSTPGSAGPFIGGTGSWYVEGYSTTRGDRAGRPLLDAGAVTTITLWSGNSNAGQALVHVAADGNSNSSVNGFSLNNGRWIAIDCTATACVTGFDCDITSNTGNVINCRADNCTTGFSGPCLYCLADTCTTGFSTAAWVKNCVAADCTSDGFVLTGNAANAYFCISYSNTSDGFSGTSTGHSCVGCIATENGAYGFNLTNTSILERCASYLNSTARSTTVLNDANSITLSGDPFVNAASGDFNLNNTAGAGADLRAVTITL